MRGFPPLHLIIITIGFALLAMPLAHLTSARPATSTAAETSSPSTTPTLIRVRFAHVPQSVSLKHDGRELLPASSIEFRAELTIPPDGIELFLTATWPAGTPDTAITVELEPDGLETQSQTRWSNGGSLAEPLLFHWKP